MKRTLLLGLALSALASPAMAHTGAHADSFVTQIIHWLSSPVHSAGTFLALAAIGGVAYFIKRRKA